MAGASAKPRDRDVNPTSCMVTLIAVSRAETGVKVTRVSQVIPKTWLRYDTLSFGVKCCTT